MASDMFYTAFTRGGSPVVECDFCGRTHYSDRLDAEELEHYRQMEQQHPNKYCSFGEYDAISYCELGGMVYPHECPCNAIDKYEQFIWREREHIIDYLRQKTTRDSEDALVEKQRVDQAVELHTTAKRVAESLLEANRRLAMVTDYM